MNIRKGQRGQAIAEYMPLIPPVLLLSVLILVPVGEHTSDIFCRMVHSMDPEKCVVDQVDPTEEPTEEPEEDTCVTLQEEQGGSQCDQHDDCSLLPGLNNGSYLATEDIDAFVIKAGQEYHVFRSGLTDDGCYYVEIEGSQVSWDKVGHGPSCKDVSHSQVWKTMLCE